MEVDYSLRDRSIQNAYQIRFELAYVQADKFEAPFLFKVGNIPKDFLSLTCEFILTILAYLRKFFQDFFITFTLKKNHIIIFY